MALFYSNTGVQEQTQVSAYAFSKFSKSQNGFKNTWLTVKARNFLDFTLMLASPLDVFVGLFVLFCFLIFVFLKSTALPGINSEHSSS